MNYNNYSFQLYIKTFNVSTIFGMLVDFYCKYLDAQNRKELNFC